MLFRSFPITGYLLKRCNTEVELVALCDDAYRFVGCEIDDSTIVIRQTRSERVTRIVGGNGMWSQYEGDEECEKPDQL